MIGVEYKSKYLDMSTRVSLWVWEFLSVSSWWSETVSHLVSYLVTIKFYPDSAVRTSIRIWDQRALSGVLLMICRSESCLGDAPQPQRSALICIDLVEQTTAILICTFQVGLCSRSIVILGPLKVHQNAWSKTAQISRFLSKPFSPIFIRNSDHASAKPNFYPNFRLDLLKPLFWFYSCFPQCGPSLCLLADSSLQQQKVGNFSNIRS